MFNYELSIEIINIDIFFMKVQHKDVYVTCVKALNKLNCDIGIKIFQKKKTISPTLFFQRIHKGS